jgi:hypothetical protein
MKLYQVIGSYWCLLVTVLNGKTKLFLAEYLHCDKETYCMREGNMEHLLK